KPCRPHQPEQDQIVREKPAAHAPTDWVYAFHDRPLPDDPYGESKQTDPRNITEYQRYRRRDPQIRKHAEQGPADHEIADQCDPGSVAEARIGIAHRQESKRFFPAHSKAVTTGRK